MTVRLAVFRDYSAEGWPSMDLCADMLLANLPAAEPRLSADDVCPRYRTRFQPLPCIGRNADRLVNRLWDYPRCARRIATRYDAFHLVDHSYSQLLHALPTNCVGVFCHDLDTFRCVLDPAAEPRPRWFRAMAKHILSGFAKAAVVFHPSAEVGRQIVRFGLADESRVVHAPNGTSSEFSANDDPLTPRPLPTGLPFLLHVGSTIPRKRIDVLLNVFAEVRRGRDIRLVQVGGDWTSEQKAQISRLGIVNVVTQVRGLSRKELAGLYREAALVLQPSEAEGFGLPVVEALACGAVVVASDIPVLHEVGGHATVYCPVSDVAMWTNTVAKLLDGAIAAPLRTERLAHASKFTWAQQARTIGAAYLRLLGVS
ncbi:MAG: glycosyltransferase family 1 protein [Gemmataceae bacterium]